MSISWLPGVFPPWRVYCSAANVFRVYVQLVEAPPPSWGKIEYIVPVVGAVISRAGILECGGGGGKIKWKERYRGES
ncbi:hypothetical protein ES708_19791 [subsurface metagenome]